MIRSKTKQSAIAIVLALVTLTASITAGVVFAAGPAVAHGDHTDGGGTDGSNEWATDSDSFKTQTVLSGLDRPTETVFLPDGRILIIQQGGKILIDDPTTKGGAETYLDINQVDSLESNRERGLLGIAIAPDFEQSGDFYVYYTRLDNPGAEDEADTEPENVLAAFTHRENSGGTTSRADPNSKQILWRNEIRTGNSIVCCHFGGGLDIGPDGKIYITTGEEFQGWRSQDLSVPDGKVIRLNQDGSIPQDNPFVDDGDPETLGEVWAYGLRNPYRAKFAPNGNLYIGEVGSNREEEPSSQEDIHLGAKGANYGWPNCEGNCDDPAYDDPIYTYSHIDSGDPPGAAVTVGPVYAGDMYPAEYDNVLFYSDYNDGWVKYLTLNDDGTTVGQSYNFDADAGPLVSLTVGPDGALYGTNYGGPPGAGEIVRYVYEDTNSAPSIDSTSVSPESGAIPLEVTFEASASDPNGDDLTYTWHFGDGTTTRGASVTHTYSEAGSYDTYVEVSDGNTTVESGTTTITAGEPPQVEITTPANGSLFRAGDSIDVAADVTDPEDGRLSGDSVEWSAFLTHNDHIHPDTTTAGNSFTFDVPTTGHPTTGDVGYRLSVTATDSDGLQTTKSIEIRPDEVDVTLKTEPDGIPIDIEGSPKSTDGGYTFDTVIGYQHSPSAPESVCRQGTTYEFTGWSDDNTERVRTFTVPESDTTLTAQYQSAGSCEDLPESGLVGHYEADSGVQMNASGVTGWTDKSGNGNDLSAAGAPQFDADGANGAGAIAFDGEDDVLDRSGLTGFSGGSEDRSMFLVANYTDNNGGFGGVAYGRGGNNKAFGLVVDDKGRLTVQGFGGGNDFPSDKQGLGAGRLTQSVVYEGGQFTQYANGQQLNSGTHQFDTNPQRFVVGGEITPPPYTEMRVSAVLVYNRALSTEERQQVQSYLSEKYIGNSTTEPNDPPELGDISVTYTGGEKAINVTATASDPDGDVDPSSVRIVEQPTSGTVTNNGDGTVTYATSDESAASDSFTVAISDTDGAESDPATVDLTYQISETNAPPTANDDDANVTVGQSVKIPVLGNDGDSDGSLDASSVTIVAQPSTGSVTIDGDGAITYTHTGDSATTDSFTYEVSDDDGDISNVATVEITVAEPDPGDGVPETNDDHGTVESGQTVTLSVLANDSASVDASTLRIDGDADHGTATVENGQLVYQHSGDSATNDMIEYTVADANGNRSAPTFVFIDITESTDQDPEEGDTDESDGGDNGGEDGSNDGDNNSGGSSPPPSNNGGGGDDRPSRPSNPSGSSGGSGSVPSAEQKASFEVSNVALSSTNVAVGETVNASAVVDNIGNAEGSTTVGLAVGNDTVDARSLTVGAGANVTVAFSYTFDQSGAYELRLGNQSLGTVTVSNATQTNESNNGDTGDGDSTSETVTEGTGTDERNERVGNGNSSSTETRTATDEPTTTVTADDENEENSTETETNTGTPGFGPLVAVLSVLLAVVMLGRRRLD
ncbi:PQQ-dependent sugar dehydrogenase [Halogeometricum borinquense]|uniref:PQQ-dependent sugar dehydrogenase n=1 Tax=Halogeometricum borinquense TaxID=60847 RepID=UPI0034424DAF